MPVLYRPALLTLSILAVLTLAGCGSGATPPANAAPTPTPQAQREAQPLAADQKEAVDKFAKSIAESMAAHDPAPLNKAFDLEGVIDRAVAGLSLPANFVTGMKKGAKQNSMASQLVEQIKNGGSYSLLRTRALNGKPTMLFRMISPENAVNYSEWHLEPAGDSFKATDVYIYATGENLSDTFRELAISQGSKVGGLLSKLSGSEAAVVKNLKEFSRATDLLRSGDAKGANAIFAGLPEEMRNRKSVLLVWMNAAQQVSDDEYNKVMDVFVKTYKGDPAVDLVQIDYYYNKKEFSKGIEAIQRLEQRLGGDPYLECLRASLLAEAGKHAEAMPIFKTALEKEPELQQGYWMWVTASLGQKNFAETSRLLTVLEDKFEMEFEDLTKEPLYAEYAKSAEYKQWLKRPRTQKQTN